MLAAVVVGGSDVFLVDILLGLDLPDSLSSLDAKCRVLVVLPSNKEDDCFSLSIILNSLLQSYVKGGAKNRCGYHIPLQAFGDRGCFEVWPCTTSMRAFMGSRSSLDVLVTTSAAVKVPFPPCIAVVVVDELLSLRRYLRLRSGLVLASSRLVCVTSERCTADLKRSLLNLASLSCIARTRCVGVSPLFHSVSDILAVESDGGEKYSPFGEGGPTISLERAVPRLLG